MSVYCKKNPCVIVFKIKDFSALSNFSGGSLYSTFDNLGLKINFNFYFHVGGQCSCLFEIPDSGYLSISYKFELICNDNSVLCSNEFQNEFQSQPSTSEWKNFIEYDHILRNKDKYLVRDCLTLHVFLWDISLQLPNFKRILCYSKVLKKGRCSLTWRIQDLQVNDSYQNRCSFSNGYSFVVNLMCTEHNDIKLLIEMSNEKLYLKSRIVCQTQLSALADIEIRDCQYVSDEGTFEIPSFNIGDRRPDEIILKCKFSLIGHTRQARNEYEFKTNIEDPNSDIPNALQDFLYMFNNQKATDVCLQADGKKLFAHKFVLISRSPVFRAMFDHNTLEKQSDIILVEDISFDIVKEFLSYLYGAPLQNLNYEKCMDLMKAATKYQVLSLKHECSSFLQSALCEENFCEILLTSEMLYEKQLKTASIEYFKKNRKRILDSKEWNKFSESHKDIAFEILTKFAKDI